MYVCMYVYRPPYIFRNLKFKAVFFSLTEIKISLQFNLNFYSFIHHPHYPLIFSPVPKVADKRREYILIIKRLYICITINL